GASDAGIYVGQSTQIVLRDNRAEMNVAGIEIENSTYADVYNNTATNNTGGILVFNLPGLPVKDGRKTRVYSNHIHDNNTDNFAPRATSSRPCRPAPASWCWRTTRWSSSTIASRTIARQTR